MKLITLNIWGGRVQNGLSAFFKAHKDVDIFCFQEVFRYTDKNTLRESTINVGGQQPPDHDLFNSLGKYLSSHRGEFCQTFKSTYGLAIFLKTGIEILHSGETFVARGDWDTNNDKDTNDHHRKIQWM